MLVLSRYKDQSIYIGDDIVITVVDVRGDRIRLGIEAPPDVAVHRQEIYEAIQKDKRAARNGNEEKILEKKTEKVAKEKEDEVLEFSL